MSRTTYAGALLVAAGLAMGGCGGGDKSSGTSSSAASPPAGAEQLGPGGPPSGGQPKHGIGALTLRQSEIPGFVTAGVSTATTAAKFAANEGLAPAPAGREAARLQRAGFVAGAIEHLFTRAGAEGLSA